MPWGTGVHGFADRRVSVCIGHGPSVFHGSLGLFVVIVSGIHRVVSFYGRPVHVIYMGFGHLWPQLAPRQPSQPPVPLGSTAKEGMPCFPIKIPRSFFLMDNLLGVLVPSCAGLKRNLEGCIQMGLLGPSASEKKKPSYGNSR